MKYKFIPNYIINTSAGMIVFDNEGMFEATKEWQNKVLEDTGAKALVEKKVTKKIVKEVTE